MIEARTELDKELNLLRNEIYNTRTKLMRKKSVKQENKLNKDEIGITFDNYTKTKSSKFTILEYEYGRIGRLRLNTTNTHFARLSTPDS